MYNVSGKCRSIDQKSLKAEAEAAIVV